MSEPRYGFEAFDCAPALRLEAHERVASLQFEALDRRLERIGLPTQYGSSNPFGWMSETMDLSKEKNFFETRVTEYQTGGALDWD